MSLLQIKDLTVSINTAAVLTKVNLSLAANQTLALVGASGSGKSVLALSLLQLLPKARYSGHIYFNGEYDLLTLTPRRLRAVRGKEIALVFQEPMTALNPLLSVGRQLTEIFTARLGYSKAAARKQITALLADVGLAGVEQRLEQLPHQFSGGQRQRLLLAMALAFKPKLLVADEPTTALDAGLRLQILTLIDSLKKKIRDGGAVNQS